MNDVPPARTRNGKSTSGRHTIRHKSLSHFMGLAGIAEITGNKRAQHALAAGVVILAGPPRATHEIAASVERLVLGCRDQSVSPGRSQSTLGMSPLSLRATGEGVEENHS